MPATLLTAREVAELLRIKLSTVYALCRRGDLSCIRIGNYRRRPLIRFRREDIDLLIRGQTSRDGYGQIPFDGREAR